MRAVSCRSGRRSVGQHSIRACCSDFLDNYHDKARYLSGLGSPLEVLEAVALGVDLIDSAYAHEMASQGYALDLPTVIPSEQPAAPDGGTQDGGAQEDGNPSSAGGLPGKLNLRSRTYRRDARPMVEGCTCACCSAHTRAYIHHMLQCHELAGEVLLNVHNTHNFSQFLAAVRASIAQGASCVLRYQIVGFKVAHAVAKTTQILTTSRALRFPSPGEFDRFAEAARRQLAPPIDASLELESHPIEVTERPRWTPKYQDKASS